MAQPKPIELSKLKRARSKLEDQHLQPIELIPIPAREEKDILEKIGDRLPFLILRHGSTVIDKILQWSALPAPLGIVLKLTSKGLTFCANRFGVKQK